jgi:hypothetical protein
VTETDPDDGPRMETFTRNHELWPEQTINLAAPE